jgi:hypothetical protein
MYYLAYVLPWASFSRIRTEKGLNPMITVSHLLTPQILVTQEAEIRRVTVQSQPGQIL